MYELFEAECFTFGAIEKLVGDDIGDDLKQEKMVFKRCIIITFSLWLLNIGELFGAFEQISNLLTKEVSSLNG